MLNTTVIFAIILPLVSKIIPYLLPLFTFILGWMLNSRLADRQFLRGGIYSPLYCDIKQIANNISEFEIYFKTDTPHNVGNTRKSLLESGQYALIPKKIRNKIDFYYEYCEEYHNELNGAHTAIKQICTDEIKKLKTEENHNNLLRKIDEKRNDSFVYGINILDCPKILLRGRYSLLPDLDDDNGLSLFENYGEWDSIITKDDLNRNSISLEDIIEHLIKLVGQEETVVRLRELQQQLKNPENLLENIEQKINNPNPLIEKLGI